MKNIVKFIMGFCIFPGVVLGFLYLFLKCSFITGMQYAQEFAEWLP